ncbi:MAG TPA: TonB-dependent receptor, partial [Saprospiraceae bacterium]|nr:TonB-dependent receptor [Saprospiraceae bacterium]
MKNIFLTFALLSAVAVLHTQNTATVSGVLKDALNGETLIGATVEAVGLGKGNVSNEYGFYSITLPAGKDSVTLKFSYIGYQTVFTKIKPQAGPTRLDISLEPEGSILNEVVIKANPLEEKIRSTEMSVATISTREAKALPALFGEVDVIKILQLKPGITPGSEGTTGLFVRGGNSDQNLIVLDEAVVYNANHLFGFFSTFNSDAVKDLKVYKGGFPAQYGGRLSSVIDVRMKEGNNQKFSGSGGLGLIASRLTLEGPIQKDKSSFIVSGRRTYADLITRAVNRANEDNPDYNKIPDYYFYDLNTKVNFTLSPKDRLYLSGYFGRDVFKFKDENFDFLFDWGNATGTARW